MTERMVWKRYFGNCIAVSQSYAVLQSCSPFVSRRRVRRVLSKVSADVCRRFPTPHPIARTLKKAFAATRRTLRFDAIPVSAKRLADSSP